MSRHRRPKPIEPWKIPAFGIFMVFGFLIAAAMTGGG